MARWKVGTCLTNLAHALLDFHGAIVSHSNAPRIVSAVFELFQAAQDDDRRIGVGPNVTKNATHSQECSSIARETAEGGEPRCSRRKKDRQASRPRGHQVAT